MLPAAEVAGGGRGAELLVTEVWGLVEARGALLEAYHSGMKVWVNGELVSTRQGRNISVADQMVVPVTLTAGWNRVLLKVADLDGGWAFHLRAADPSGELRWSATGTG